MPPPITWILSYNGYEFDAFARTSIDCRPIWDDARRTITAIEHTINVKTHVADGASTGASVEEIRHKLLSVGGPLKVNGKGFGTSFEVNTGATKDVNFGPKPQLLRWDPIGNDKAAIIEWQCVATIPYGLRGVGKTSGQLMAFNFTLDFDIDEQGLTTVRFHGYFEIPMTRSSSVNKTLPDTVDKYREQVMQKYPSIPGYRRQQQNFSLSPDKKRCNFSIVDKQLPIPLADGTIRSDISHRISSGLSKGEGAFGIFLHTFSGSITTAPNEPKSLAYKTFLRIVRFRLQYLEKVVRKKCIIPQHFDATEEIFGLTSHFNMSFKVFNLKTIIDHVGASQLWTPLPGGITFRSWNASLKRTANDMRGYAGLRHKPEGDLIIDLLGTPPQVPFIPPEADPSQVGIADAVELPRPDPDHSWAFYFCDYGIDEDDRVIRHKPMNTKPEPKPPRPLVLDPVQAFKPLDTTTGVTGGNDIIQRVSSPDYTIIIRGMAIRVGYDIPTPRLLTANGIPVTQQWQRVRSGPLTQYDGVPLYYARWQIGYIVPRDPGKGAMPTNPWLGVQGD